MSCCRSWPYLGWGVQPASSEGRRGPWWGQSQCFCLWGPWLSGWAQGCGCSRGKRRILKEVRAPFPNTLQTKHAGALCRPRSYLWHVGKPLQDGVNAFKVITDSVMGHPVVVHDLDPSQLVVGGVNFPSKHLGKEKRESHQCWEVSRRCWLGRIKHTPSPAAPQGHWEMKRMEQTSHNTAPQALGAAKSC